MLKLVCSFFLVTSWGSLHPTDAWRAASWNALVPAECNACRIHQLPPRASLLVGSMVRSPLTALKYKITLKLPTGQQSEIECSSDTYILDAAEEAGVEMPYSCRAGSCSSCAGKLESGEVDDGEQSFLDEQQKEKGYILTCVGMPKSDCVIVTDQEENLH